MKVLLREAARLTGDSDLERRMDSAYVFRITFGHDFGADAGLLPHLAISYRMLYQLYTGSDGWMSFASKLKEAPPLATLSVDDVIEILARKTQIYNAKDMTVVLCVDNIDQCQSGWDLHGIMAEVSTFMKTSSAFVVCACAGTITWPLRGVFRKSRVWGTYLVPPTLSGDVILTSTSTRVERYLVEDMGGHGRALETLDEVLLNCWEDGVVDVNVNYVIRRIGEKLCEKYGEVFAMPMFSDYYFCQAVVAAIISRRHFSLYDQIGDTGTTVKKLLGFGLFSLSHRDHGCLECAFFLLEILMWKLQKQADNIAKHFANTMLVWQWFEQFVAAHRRTRSIALSSRNPLPLATFHAGARFGDIDGIFIEEPSSRKVIEASEHLDTSSQPGKVEQTFVSSSGEECKTHTKTIFINAPNAPYGDIFMQIQLTEATGQSTRCYEVIQCKYVKRKINETLFFQERAKAVGDSDMFLLTTSVRLTTQFSLPPRCGVVSYDEFREYFGPYASRAFRSLLDPPDINTASIQILSMVGGLGDATIRLIVEKRPFSSIEQAVSEVVLNNNINIANAVRSLACYPP